MATGSSTSKHKHIASKVLTIFLLISFWAGSSNIQFLHSIVHDHDVMITHTAEQEKDPCHRMIYHHIAEQDSSHDSHLFASEKCQMCDLASHRDQTFQPNLVFATSGITSEYYAFHKLSLDSYWAVISSSRAPPSLI